MRIFTWVVASALCVLYTASVPAEEAPPVIRLGSKPSELISVKITVSDLRKSFDFYTKLIGLKEVEIPGVPKVFIDDPAPTFAEVILNFSGSLADPYLILVKQKGVIPTPEQARLTWVVIKVANNRATVDRIKATGLSMLQEPSEMRGMVYSWLQDPDGYIVEFLEAQSVGQ